jgi:hypothetical protein
MMTLMDEGKCPCRCHASTSSPAGSPAKTLATPAGAQDSKGRARVFGQSTPVSLASFDRDTSSWRTSQLSLLGGSEPFSATWPRSGMTRSGTAFQLQPLAPLTGGTAFGSWPTPHGICQPGPRQPGPSGNELGRAVNHAETWGTPTSRDWKDVGDMTNVPTNGLLGRQVLERTWPTPKASDSRRDPGQASRWGPGNSQRSNLKDALRYRQAEAGQPTTGSLNPTWVEWLMGFPLGWTDLEVSETRSSRRSQSGSGDASSTTKPSATE